MISAPSTRASTMACVTEGLGMMLPGMLSGWLQELPDPVTKLVWDNAGAVSPKTAEALGVDEGDFVAIRVRDLTMAFGDFVLMRDLNFEIRRGDVFVIMGGSGCGKSTLMRHLLGMIEPAQGEIFYRSVFIVELPANDVGVCSKMFCHVLNDPPCVFVIFG